MVSSPEMYIQVDNPARAYFPGQTITGRVVTSFVKPKDKCNNLGIAIEGKARVFWTETRTRQEGTGQNRRSVSHTVTFMANEDYFNAQLVLLSGGTGKLTIPAGTSVYPFQFMLPQNLPSSYTSTTGKVMYFMTARITRAWNRFDITCTLPFTINGVLDLNREIRATEQIALSKDKTICCFCCKSGPIGFRLSIPRSGFVPGECIPIMVEMSNMSRRKIIRSTLKLMQTVTYHAQGKSRQNKRTICEARGPGVERGESETWNDLNALRIPAVPPTRLAGCHIIDCDYSLGFTMEISGVSSNLRTQFPIIIGTIPLRQFFVDLMPSSVTTMTQDLNGAPDYNRFLPSYPGPGPSHSTGNQNFNTTFQPGPPQPSAPIFDAYPDLPPPTYAEAISNESFGIKPTSYENPAVFAGEGDIKSKIESSESEPTAPPPEYDFSNDDSFVPNYITYGFIQK